MAMHSKMAPPPRTDADPAGDEPSTNDPSAGAREALPSSLPVRVGEMVDGKYRVERVLGQGGMGVVVAAHDVGLDRAVAIKLLHRPQPHGQPSAHRAAPDREFSARFRREARAMAKLTNEHFVRVLDIGELSTGEPFLVMERLEGTDLAARVEKDGPLSVPEVADYVVQACEAIAEAHSIGIVHRDLKPSNMYLARRPDGTLCIKVLDFGIAKMTSEDAEIHQSLTHTTAFLGSPAYMSPEQLLCARDVGAQADIWSLGAIMHKLLVGQPPFVAPTIPQVCSLIISSQPARACDLRPEIPSAFQDVILRCLQRYPADRFGDVAELARALAPFAPASARGSVERASSTLRRSVRPGAESSLETVEAPAPALPDSRSPRSRTAKVALVAAGIVVAAALALAIATRTRASGVARPAAAPSSSQVVAAPVASAVEPPGVAFSSLPPSPLPENVPGSPPAASARSSPPPSPLPRRSAPRAPREENAEFGGRK
jgi:serine/threonine-protein kinase